MKNIVLAAILVSGVAFGQAKKVTNSTVQWWGYKLAKTEASSHNGNVNLRSGDIVLKNNKIVGGTFLLDMNSINATDLSGESQMKLNNHLKNGDFFETNKFPSASYTITSVSNSTNKSFPYLVKGNLTAKGVTKPVSFPATISMKSGVLNLVSDKFSFDRQQFGINYASAAKDVVIKDDIDLIINVTAK